MSEIDAELAPARRIAVVGAGGFVGARLMQTLYQHSQIKGVGIVRSAKSLARLSSTPLEVRVVNTSRVAELEEAFSDCETVVNAINGDISQVLRETKTVHQAALDANCRLLIHLSSAVVFGRAESSSLRDDSTPDTRNWMLYARGKAESEMFLRSAIGAHGLRVVVLRPGLVWGPGSNWAVMVGEQLSRGRVCLSNAGRGIANLIYVDNLVKAILMIQETHAGPSGFYNLSDPEIVTWQRYYQGLARRLGYAETDVRTWPDAHLPLSPRLAMEWCLQQKPLYRAAKWLQPRLGPDFKAVAKRLLKGDPVPPDDLQASPQSAPRLTREHWSLQNTSYRLPMEKLLTDYGPIGFENFENALDATAAWLRFAGYAAVPQDRLTQQFECSYLW